MDKGGAPRLKGARGRDEDDEDEKRGKIGGQQQVYPFPYIVFLPLCSAQSAASNTPPPGLLH